MGQYRRQARLRLPRRRRDRAAARFRGPTRPARRAASLSSSPTQSASAATRSRSIVRSRWRRTSAPPATAFRSSRRWRPACAHASATLGVVHAYSTHNLLLRYWLATAGIEAGRDFKLAVVPPARAVEALTSGQIAGFCAGAPWGEVARRAGVGATVATSARHLAECAGEGARGSGALGGRTARRRSRARSAPCCGPRNFAMARRMATYTAALLSRRRYLDVDPHAILAGLPGGTAPDKGCVFFRGAATFPWRSHGLWFLERDAALGVGR